METEAITEALGAALFTEDGASAFAVIDGASVQGLLDKLYGLQPEFACLYRGELAPDMAEVAPYLVRLERASEFADWLVSEGWGKHWGVFALAHASLREMRRHFRSFLTVYDPEGKPLLFRYYDPRVLRVYLPTCDARELETIFGPVGAYLLEGVDPGDLLRFELSSGALQQRTKPLAPG
jgi:hypothetical protein